MAARERTVALMWHGDGATRNAADPFQTRFSPIAYALKDMGFAVEPAVYNDDFADEVLEQLLHVDAVQVWVNPIESGRDRSRLDALLREVADSGVLVSAHPETILKMGTKEVLYRTKDMSWGSDVDLYATLQELVNRLPTRLANGARVLKQNRGHSGGGIWKVQRTESDNVLFRHAQRGSKEETISLQSLFETFKPYFENGGQMIDQAYQERLVDGMVRCYMVSDEVAGFGHQEVNALYPAPAGADSSAAPDPGPRLYYPPDDPRFASVKSRMESEWLSELLKTLEMQVEELPLLWDADFFLGEKDEEGNDTYVLCEINVSSVAPFPESAAKPFARVMRARITSSRSG